jgi:hypothetical protein
MAHNASAPPTVLKQPHTFCGNLTMRRSRSARRILKSLPEHPNTRIPEYPNTRINYCNRCLATLSAERHVVAPRRATAEKVTAVVLLVISFLVMTGFFVGVGLLMTTLR